MRLFLVSLFGHPAHAAYPAYPAYSAHASSFKTIDDQTRITPEDFLVANPSPLSRAFEKANEEHEVLVALFDNGFDYNHPFLLSSWHFDLGESQEPSGLGYDFVGEDSWPAPYIVNTAVRNLEAPSREKQAAANVSYHLSGLSASYTNYSEFLDSRRRIDQESSLKVFHGTALSYLMGRDNPWLGIVPFRVLPDQLKVNKNSLHPDAQNVAFLRVLSRAINQALLRGIRLFAIPIFVEFESPISDLLLAEIRLIEELIQKHPETLFVVSIGHGGQRWASRQPGEERDRFGFPCGLDLPNVVCVGGLDREGKVWRQSDVLIDSTRLVLAPGEEILTSGPTLMCGLGNNLWTFLDQAPSYPFWQVGSSYHRYWLGELERQCLREREFQISGTSLSLAFVTLGFAELLKKNPNMSVAGLLTTFFHTLTKSVRDSHETFPAYYPVRPQWYPPQEKQPWN